MKTPTINSSSSVSVMAALVLLSFTLTIILPIATVSAHETATLSFLECLNKNSNPNIPIPISTITYTPRNTTSYSSVFEAYLGNLRFNESTTRKPSVIITASYISHVQAAVICSKQHGLQIKTRSGGHDYEGLSYVSIFDPRKFLVLDMFNLREINVSIEDETAWVEAGATLGEVYYRISEKSNVHGFPSGVCPTVGVGGHFSGGGYGNLIRKYGLSVDNIIDAKIIDANGRVLDRASMGEDLFWAITGGGGASFGVIYAYKIKLVRVPPKVTVFLVERNNDINIAQRWQQVAPYLHEDLFIRMIVSVVNGTSNSNKTHDHHRSDKTIRIAFMALFLGNSTRLLSLMNQSFPELGLQERDCTEMRWIESTLFWNEFPDGTPIETLLNRVRQKDYSKNKSDYINKPMSKAGIKALFNKMLQLETPFIQFNPYGGRMREISPNAKPFPHRNNLIKLQYITVWRESGTDNANQYINLSRSLYEFMTPFVNKSPRDSFLNYRDIDLGVNHHGRNSYWEGTVYGFKYYKGNYNRLVKIKTKVDPENFFRNEQSIPVFPSWR